MKRISLFAEDISSKPCQCGNELNCIYFIPKEYPGEPHGRGLCENPKIKQQTSFEWKEDRLGLKFFKTKQMKNGKSKLVQLSMEERPDFTLNMLSCPGQVKYQMEGQP